MDAREDLVSAVICVLLDRIGLDRRHPGGPLWTAAGPTPGAVDVIGARARFLSAGQATMLAAAWSIWDGRFQVTLESVTTRLSREHAEALLTGLLAIRRGDAAVEAWLRDPRHHRILGGEHCGAQWCTNHEPAGILSGDGSCVCPCSDCRCARDRLEALREAASTSSRPPSSGATASRGGAS